MYKIQEKPHARAVLTNGEEVKPLVTLVDEGHGTSHIIMDDGCYVLINGQRGGGYGMSCHWFPEAAQALAGLMAAPIDVCRTSERPPLWLVTVNTQGLSINTEDAAKKVREEVQAWRDDPQHIVILPFPVSVQVLD